MAKHVERGIYISYHTNAGGGSGTETYSYSGDATAGSQLLRNLLQEEVVGDVRSAWDPGWGDRGVKEANFGELRLLDSMPGALIETAFHDNPDDLAAERAPTWRKVVSRAIYHAVARYVHGDGATLLPEPPRSVSAQRSGPTSVRLSWQAPLSGAQACGAGRATRYRVAFSRNGLDFASLEETPALSATVTQLPRATPLFFRVTALNAGGESLPARTAAVVLPETEGALRVLLVHAFPADEGVLRRTVYVNATLGEVLRLEPGRTPGGGDSGFDHLWALWTARREAACDFLELKGLDTVALGDYDLVSLVFGDQEENVLSEGDAQRLTAFLDGGGKVIVSGSRCARAVTEGGGPLARERDSIHKTRDVRVLRDRRGTHGHVRAGDERLHRVPGRLRTQVPPR